MVLPTPIQTRFRGRMPEFCKRARSRDLRPVRHRVEATRSGAAAIELAVCLPVILLLVFGAVEASSQIFLKQSLSIACYEAGRAATDSTINEDAAAIRAKQILDSRGVHNYEIRFPSGVSEVERGDTVICEVSAPILPNSPLARRFIANRTLTARTVMIKE